MNEKVKQIVVLALNGDIHKQLKVKSVELETTMQAIIEKLIVDWLDSQKK